MSVPPPMTAADAIERASAAACSKRLRRVVMDRFLTKGGWETSSEVNHGVESLGLLSSA